MRPQRCIAQPGEPGDCYRACLATITGLPIETIPNFNAGPDGASRFDDPVGMANDVRAFLAPYGFGVFNNYCNGEWPLERVLSYFSEYNAGVPIILIGSAKLVPGEYHAVVALDGVIAHDPSGAGIAGPMLPGGEPWWFFDAVCLASNFGETKCEPLLAA